MLKPVQYFIFLNKKMDYSNSVILNKKQKVPMKDKV